MEGANMAYVFAKCYKCKKRIKVNDADDAWICKFCRKPFIVEKAINYYKVLKA
jgi:hypothetical protein